ncbi:MAG: nucleoside deaminase [Alphaproteobacteria bacterium]|nr:nucleoside deaminase [Alphaproteobacteria bacterium]
MPHPELPSLRHRYSRRNWLWRFAAAPLSAIAIEGAGAAADTGAPALLAETAEQRLIAMAFEMRSRATAEGDQPYGAVVVKGGEIVAATPSRVVTRSDPTAHAEMEALRDAARQLSSRDLRGCLLYSSSRPCPMCEAAAYWAGIERFYHGQTIVDGGAPMLRRC